MQRNCTGEPNIRARIPLYIAGLGASSIGLLSLNTILSNAEFTLLAFVLLALGFSVSWTVRAGVLSAPAVSMIALTILIPTLAAVLMAPSFKQHLLPTEVLEGTDLTAAVLLAWLMVIYSYRLATDTAVLFLCVPSMSLLGLVATFNPSLQMLTYFAIFLALACFALIQQNALSSREERADTPESLRFHAPSVKLHIGITASVALTALAMGITVGTLFYPLLVRAFSAQMQGLDATQMVDQLAAEEFVPVATGPVNLSEEEVMVVRCDRHLLWRGRTFNKYTGRGWSSDLLAQEQMWIHPVKGAPIDGLTDSDRWSSSSKFAIPQHSSSRKRPSVKLVKQTFRITSGLFKTVFAAAEPETITFNVPQPLLRLRGGLEASRPYTRNTTYTVISQVSTATPRQLMSASGIYPETIEVQYLGTPESCWQVQNLAQRVTAGITNPYGKALAIQNHLEFNYTYDTNAPAVPEGEDAVTYFLFKTRRGYCDIFASAMVIMCQQVGIPARWATGFAPGELSETDGAYHVRAKDRHAWAELYFPDYGWIAFDVTPTGSNPSFAAHLRESWDIFLSDKSSIFAGALIILLAGYLVKVELIDRMRRTRDRPRKQPAAPVAETARNYRKMCRLLARFGFPRHPAATPREYAAELGYLFLPQLGHLSAAVDSLTHDFIEYRYASRELPAERATAMVNTLQSLSRYLKIARRQKLLPQP